MSPVSADPPNAAGRRPPRARATPSARATARAASSSRACRWPYADREGVQVEARLAARGRGGVRVEPAAQEHDRPGSVWTHTPRAPRPRCTCESAAAPGRSGDPRAPTTPGSLGSSAPCTGENSTARQRRSSPCSSTTPLRVLVVGAVSITNLTSSRAVSRRDSPKGLHRLPAGRALDVDHLDDRGRDPLRRPGARRSPAGRSARIPAAAPSAGRRPPGGAARRR